MNRRESIRALTVGFVALLAGNRNALAHVAKTPMTVYKDPGCGCCKAWVKHVTAAGFDVTAIDVSDVEAYKKKYGVPEKLQSCHTAIANGYVFEGHVPADLVQKFLAAPPKNAKGLAVPGMPMGAPGMEMGTMKDAYDVIAFSANGTTSVYAHR